MENLNNKYNFKNPIRHFFNLENIKFNNLETLKFDNLSWTVPVKCKIFKTENLTRTISFPNLLNFYKTLEEFEKNIVDFHKIKNSSNRKRISPDLKTGEFSVMSYSQSIQNDLSKLTQYDKLMILDIKSFYGRIYTHDCELNNYINLEQRVTSLNQGRTNGLLLGSYLSLYLAEKFLIRIEKELDKKLKDCNINCYFEYFSDDFYFFCNNNDMEKIKNIFAEILDNFELQLNERKIVILDFEEYSISNNLDKQWKKIIKNEKEKNDVFVPTQKEKKYPTFLTQLVYRLTMITELKYKRIFLNNFFKTSYFHTFDSSKYSLSQSDFNYLCYIYKLMPETMLYSLNKMLEMQEFQKESFKKYIELRFQTSLETEKHDEQLYIFYAIKICGFQKILIDSKKKVLKSKNQILISYFLLDKIIEKNEYREFIENPQENEWLQNYHYILMYDNENLNLLIPQNAQKEKQKASYINFYKMNISESIPIVKPWGKIQEEIENYIDLRNNSYITKIL